LDGHGLAAAVFLDNIMWRRDSQTLFLQSYVWWIGRVPVLYTTTNDYAQKYSKFQYKFSKNILCKIMIQSRLGINELNS